MGIFKCYGQGIQEASLRPKMIFVLWLFNFVFASLVYFLFSSVLSAALGKSALTSNLLKKPITDLLLEFFTESTGALRSLFLVALVLMVIYFFVSIFLVGGILFNLTHAGNKERFAQVFFHGGGKYFCRFLLLTLYSLLLWIIFSIIFLGLNLTLQALTRNSDNEQLLFSLFWARAALALFFVYFLKMIMDYSRIKIVTEDSTFVFRSFFDSIKFVFRKLGKTLCLYYLLGLTGLALLLIYWGIKSLISVSSFSGVVVFFLVSQVFIASRGWLRIAFQAGQLKFFTLEYF